MPSPEDVPFLFFHTTLGYGPGGDELVELLFAAIPKEDKERLSQKPWGTEINGGTSRGWNDKAHAVATYNNTIPDEQGIIDWFERALVGIKS